MEKNNLPGQRTTLCINEAFHFLESPEYRISESTAPHEVNLNKRCISDSGINVNNHVHVKDINTKNVKIPEERENCYYSNHFIEFIDVYSNSKSEKIVSEICEVVNAKGKPTEQNRGDNLELKDKTEGSLEVLNKDSSVLYSRDFNMGGNDELDLKGDNSIFDNNLAAANKRDNNDSHMKGDNFVFDANPVSDDKGDNQDSHLMGDNCAFDIAVSYDKGDKRDSHILEDNFTCVQNNEDNQKQNSENLENSLVVPKNDDCDSGCGERLSLCVDLNAEENISLTSDNTANDGGHNDCGANLDFEKCEVVNEESDQTLTSKVIQSNNFEIRNSIDDGNDEVVRLRPKSVTSPDQRRGTTQIVSDAFRFLAGMDDAHEAIRRSSGYKSSDFPDDASSEMNRSPSNNPTDSCEVDYEKGESPVDKEKIISQEVGHVNTEKVKSVKRQKSHKEMDDDQISEEDSEEEDTGVYNESVRNSCWICVDSTPHSVMHDSIDESEENDTEENDNKTDDVFLEKPLNNINIMNVVSNGCFPNHKRTDSTATTASESEFKRSFQTRRKCFVQRNDSQQEYERMSCRVFNNERVVTLEKKTGETEFGLHILDTHPVIVSGVDNNSPAFRAGVKEGQILLMVNGVSVLAATQDRIISLVQQSGKTLQIEVANTDIHYIRDMQKPVLSGYLYKQKGSTFLRSWKRRFCVLRQDNCLYYFKTKGDVDPLGAIPMLNYTVSRHQDSTKEHCFKADKYGAKTYYFSVESREEMTKWVGAMNEASFASKKRKESWMDVTSTNVGLPALEVRKPECAGTLLKCGRTTKTWHKRYCILKDACIYYYKGSNAPRAQGMAHLHGYSVNEFSKKFSFTLKPPERQMKTFTFAAENETDKNRWMEALSKSINRWIKVD